MLAPRHRDRLRTAGSRAHALPARGTDGRCDPYLSHLS